MPEAVKYTDEDIFGKTRTAGGLTDAEVFGSEPKKPKTTKLEAGVLGVAQGVSFGFADEMEAAAKTLLEIGGGRGKTSGPTSIQGAIDRYREIRDTEARPKYREARVDQPTAFTTGEIGGALGTAFIPGFGALNVAKGAKLGVTLGKAGLSGGIAGAGASERDVARGDYRDVVGFVEDVAGGAATGAITAGALKGAVKVAGALTPRGIVKKGANILLNTPEELTELRLDRGKDAILNAPKRFELVKEYEGVLEGLKQKLITGSKEAREQLSKVKVKGSEVAEQAKALADDIVARSEGVIDDPQRNAALGWLRSIEELYTAQKGKVFSGSKIKDTIQGIDRNTQWDVGAGKFSPIDEGIKKQLRAGLSDLLKTKSPAYAKDMIEVAKDAQLLEKASNMGSEKTLANIFRRIETDEWGAGQFPREIIEQVDKRMGTDLLDKVKLSYAREAFDKSITNGSMNVNKFKNLLESIPIIGKAAGLLGASVDKYGRKMTMGAIDAAGYLENVYQKSGLKGLREAARPIEELAKRGNAAAAAGLLMIQEEYPEYKQEGLFVPRQSQQGLTPPR